jgi:glutamyl/glutaminyl-tRNA synthetase
MVIIGDISIQHYKNAGILPEALLNFVALLGWSHTQTNKEIMTVEEMIEGVCDAIAYKYSIFSLHWKEFIKLLQLQI